MRRDDIVEKLLEIDEEVELTIGIQNPKPKIVIVGGAAFLLLNSTDREVTHDIDVYMADLAVAEILSRYPELNGSVAAYEDQIPYNYENRLHVLNIGSRAVDYCVPSLEDLAVMKMYADRPSDRVDVEYTARKGLIDIDVLEDLVYGEDEARASVLSPRRYGEMVWAFERLKERLRK